MPGLGTVVNSLGIIIGAFLGLILRRGLPERWQETMMQGIGFCIAIIGIQMSLKTTNIVITIFSIVIGAMIGEFIDIEGYMNRFGRWISGRLVKDEGAASLVARGFVNASILFCTGAMAVVGSIQDGLAGDHATLFAKATLDFLIAIIMTANMGVGVALSSISVGIYQGAITLLASFIEGLISPVVLAELTAAGGIMILGIGCNMLKITSVRIANLLPGILASVIIAKLFA